MAKKLKYPKKGQRIKMPVMITDGFSKGDWEVRFLEADGSTPEKTGMSMFFEEAHCWRPCIAYNTRMGFTEKDVKQIIKAVKNGKKEQEKGKGKKAKKGKKNKSKSKSKGRKKN